MPVYDEEPATPFSPKDKRSWPPAQFILSNYFLSLLTNPFYCLRFHNSLFTKSPLKVNMAIDSDASIVCYSKSLWYSSVSFGVIGHSALWIERDMFSDQTLL